MTIRFVEEAQTEFLETISYYEEAQRGLGTRFKDEVDRCVLWVARHPELYQLRSKLYRRINLRAFPYYIPFIVRGEALWILAVAHASRKAALLDFPTRQNHLIKQCDWPCQLYSSAQSPSQRSAKISLPPTPRSARQPSLTTSLHSR